MPSAHVGRNRSITQSCNQCCTQSCPLVRDGGGIYVGLLRGHEDLRCRDNFDQTVIIKINADAGPLRPVFFRADPIDPHAVHRGLLSDVREVAMTAAICIQPLSCMPQKAQPRPRGWRGRQTAHGGQGTVPQPVTTAATKKGSAHAEPFCEVGVDHTVASVVTRDA